jgi:hypothetical protein
MIDSSDQHAALIDDLLVRPDLIGNAAVATATAAAALLATARVELLLLARARLIALLARCALVLLHLARRLASARLVLPGAALIGHRKSPSLDCAPQAGAIAPRIGKQCRRRDRRSASGNASAHAYALERPGAPSRRRAGRLAA